MKKALILTGLDPYVTTGGIETFTRELIDLLQLSGVQGRLVCASDFGNIYNLRNTFVGQVYAAGRSLSALRSGDCEFVVSNGYYGGGFFPKGLKSYTVFHSTHAGYAEAMRKHVPLSTYLEIRHVIGNLMERSAAWGAKVFAVSDKVKSELNQYYGLGTVEVIPNPVDIRFFSKVPDRGNARTRYSVPLGRRVGLFVGRWELSKGNDIFEDLIKDLRDVFWIIVACTGGQNPPRGENILILSGLSREQMKDIYCLSDFMFFPSRYEGFGLAAAEAMACGLPVISTPVGCLEGIYSQSPFSEIAIPFSLLDSDVAVPAIREKILNLFTDERLYKEISEKGRHMIAERYDTETWRESVKEILCLN